SRGCHPRLSSGLVLAGRTGLDALGESTHCHAVRSVLDGRDNARQQPCLSAAEALAGTISRGPRLRGAAALGLGHGWPITARLSDWFAGLQLRSVYAGLGRFVDSDGWGK